MDDESYFTSSHHELSGNDGYYTDNFETTPDNVKHAGITKFEPKVLVWLAISSKGISAPVIRPRGAKAINAHIYIDQCLPKLKQFIDRKHMQDEILFWPDLAGSHYAKKTLNWLTEQNIPYVPKKDNHSKVPQAHPIEDSWSVLKRNEYEKGWEAQNGQQLIGRIKRKLKEIQIICFLFKWRRSRRFEFVSKLMEHMLYAVMYIKVKLSLEKRLMLLNDNNRELISE